MSLAAREGRAAKANAAQKTMVPGNLTREILIPRLYPAIAL